MGHVPHIFVPKPWSDIEIPVSDGTTKHLRNVLRLTPGQAVSYTDGAGVLGSGLLGDGTVTRGDEGEVPAPNRKVHLLVAPPRSKDRQRFLVEKVAELGAASLTWLSGTRYGQGSPPRADRSQSWADAALEQSRGAYRTVVAGSSMPFDALTDNVLLADSGGEPIGSVRSSEVWVAIGPEGGWAPEERDGGFARVDLGPRILRVETAAMVVVAGLLVLS